MDHRLYQAARDGNVEILIEIASNKGKECFLLLSALKNNVLHIAAKLGHKLFCQTVLKLGPPTLLSQKNAIGNTPLHIAAGAGHLELVIFFVESCNHLFEGDLEGGEGSENLLEMKNTEDNTTLHLALKNRHEKVAMYLLEQKQDLANTANTDGEGAVFLAVVGCCYFVLRKILPTDKASLEGPNGQSPLHYAVAVKDIRSTKLLLERAVLTQKTDSDGRTALHYAVVARSLRMIRMLLKRDASVAYTVDNVCVSPLHIAARSGTAAMCRAILNFCPDCIEILDMNGQNALHLAVKYNTHFVVRRLLTISSIRDILNERDGEGNTALHLATKSNHFRAVKVLMNTKGIQITTKNNDGLTALDVCESESEISFRQRVVRSLLLRRKAPRGKQGHTCDNTRFGRSWLVHPKADLKQMANTLIVIATLLTTVTFTAAFTVPGGYRSDGPDIGVAVFVHKAAFKAFIFTDAVAMCCSMTVVFLLIWAMLGDLAYLLIALRISVGYLNLAFYATMIAYITGIYVAVSSKSPWLAIFVCIIGSSVPVQVILQTSASSMGIPQVMRAEFNKTQRFLGRAFTFASQI